MKSTVREPARMADVGVKFAHDESWRCACGREHSFSAYVAAHWNDELVHGCGCGAHRTFLCGEVLD